LVFIIWIGVYPKFFLTPISPAVTEILARTDQPLAEYYAEKPTSEPGTLGEPGASATGGSHKQRGDDRLHKTASREGTISNQLSTHSGR
jgi:hypothetical protein